MSAASSGTELAGGEGHFLKRAAGIDDAAGRADLFWHAMLDSIDDELPRTLQAHNREESEGDKEMTHH